MGTLSLNLVDMTPVLAVTLCNRWVFLALVSNLRAALFSVHLNDSRQAAFGL